jgi:Protein of unknown function, DUF547
MIYSGKKLVALATLIGALILMTGPGTAHAGSISFVEYAEVLAKHVSGNGLVDYAGLKANRGKLDAFAKRLAELDPAMYGKWTSNQKIAFWVNAYNALTLVAIIDNYPIQPSKVKSLAFPKNSIRQIPGVWKELQFTVMGEAKTLDQIEHQVLRKQFKEPRIHFALVCAALSCPKLRSEPYSGGRLSNQLNDQARKFLADSKTFRIDLEKKVVYLSAIFDWFGADFANGGKSEDGVISFVLLYLKGEERDFVAARDFKIKYLDYDWTLNEGR